MRTFAVAKVQGTGNDFVLLDNAASESLPFARLAQTWCARRSGIGADGLLVLEPPTTAGVDVTLRIFNADGSEAEMCGNGIRCVARYLAQKRPRVSKTLVVQTAGGIVRTELTKRDGADLVAVDMGVPRFARADIPMRGDPDARALDERFESPSGESMRVSAVSMGNPHCVAFLEIPIEHADLAAHAALLEHADLFPSGANYEVVNISDGEVRMRVFERGVGETQGCGSGACAVGVVAILTGRAQSPLDIRMPGGSVRVEWSGPGASVTLTGDAEIVYVAEIAVAAEALAASQPPAHAR